MALPELETVDIGGTPIAIRDTGGDGPALVLLHGLGSSSQSWAFQFGALGEKYRVIAWDMPGYGASGGFVRDNPTAEHYAYALDAVLDRLETGRVHIVGHSVAALIGAAYAVEHPDRTLSYTFCQGLTGLAGLAADERTRQRRARLDAMSSGGPEALAESRGPAIVGPGTPPMVTALVVAIMKRVPAKGYNQAIEMMAQTDFFALAPGVACPSLVMAGDADPVSPVAAGETARAALDKSPGGAGRMETIAGAGHLAGMENPAAFNAALSGFVEAVEARTETAGH
jgi:3-oxoadipate enol-lactonase